MRLKLRCPHEDKNVHRSLSVGRHSKPHKVASAFFIVQRASAQLDTCLAQHAGRLKIDLKQALSKAEDGHLRVPLQHLQRHLYRNVLSEVFPRPTYLSFYFTMQSLMLSGVAFLTSSREWSYLGAIFGGGVGFFNCW